MTSERLTRLVERRGAPAPLGDDVPARVASWLRADVRPVVGELTGARVSP